VRVGLWSIEQGEPRRLEQRRDFLEVDLEDWISRHPELVMDGLSWVGRQVVLPGRARLDLVGLTREGQLVIAELKRGTVDIGTLTQALSYSLSIVAMVPAAILGRLELNDDQRELLTASLENEGQFDLAMLLVGTARAPELDRASEFLTDRGLDLPIRVVTFAPFRDHDGRVFLAREVAEHEQAPEEVTPRQRSSRAARVEWIQERARELGTGDVIEEAIRMAGALGLKVRPWPKSLTIAPGTGMLKTLVYLGVKEDGRIGFGYHTDNFVELYGASADEVEAALGENWRDIGPEAARAALADFGRLMEDLLERDEVGSDEVA
jgi:hypothetical protein